MIHDHNPSDLLGLLEMSDVRPTRDDMRTWTAEQCREARQWATARWAARSVMFMGTLKPIPAFLLKYHGRTDCPKCGGSGGGPDPALACGACQGTGRRNS